LDQLDAVPNMTTKAERDEIIHEPWRARMENDFAPHHTPEQIAGPERAPGGSRGIAAFQLGQINQKLDTMIEALSASTAKT
jgi:hypothetical protein